MKANQIYHRLTEKKGLFGNEKTFKELLNMKDLQLEKTLRKKVILGHYEKYLKLKL